jgi:hypothetical protein
MSFPRKAWVLASAVGPIVQSWLCRDCHRLRQVILSDIHRIDSEITELGSGN